MYLGNAPLVVERAPSDFPLSPLEMTWLPSNETLSMKFILLSTNNLIAIIVVAKGPIIGSK